MVFVPVSTKHLEEISGSDSVDGSLRNVCVTSCRVTLVANVIPKNTSTIRTVSSLPLDFLQL